MAFIILHRCREKTYDESKFHHRGKYCLIFLILAKTLQEYLYWISKDSVKIFYALDVFLL